MHLRDGSTITGADFFQMIVLAMAALEELGVVPEDRVAVQVEKSPRALAIYAATVALGAVFLPLNTAYTADEMQYFIENARPRVVICDPRNQAALGVIASRFGAVLQTLDGTGKGAFADLGIGRTCPLIVARDADDVAVGCGHRKGGAE